jgi:hypothetical protein
MTLMGGAEEGGGEGEGTGQRKQVEEGESEISSSSLADSAVAYSSQSSLTSAPAAVGGLVNEGRSVMKTLIVTLSYCVSKMKEEADAQGRPPAGGTAPSKSEAAAFRNNDPSSSSPSIAGWGKGSSVGMHKVSSMPVMGKHAVLTRRDAKNEGGEDSDDSDYGEDSVGSYDEGDDFDKGGKGGGRKKRGKRKEGRNGKSKKEVSGSETYLGESQKGRGLYMHTQFIS